MAFIPLSQSWILVVTSALFLIPATQLWHCAQYDTSTVLVTTSLVSMNYWKHAQQHTWQHTLDLYWGKLAFVYTAGTGLWFTKDHMDILRLHGPNILVTAGLFQLSNDLYTLQPTTSHWLMCHALFHVMLIVQMCQVAKTMCS
jgi:hypothetical protein